METRTLGLKLSDAEADAIRAEAIRKVNSLKERIAYLTWCLTDISVLEFRDDVVQGWLDERARLREELNRHTLD